MTEVLDQAYYLQKAKENFPKLYTKDLLVSGEPKVLQSGDSFVLDLGNHYVGYFSFVLGYTHIYPDAPVRLCVKFCERKEELDADFSSYQGTLCPSWMQEEIVNIDFVGVYKMPRRYAARFIAIRVLHTPQTITLSDFHFSAVTSADECRLLPVVCEDPALQTIDTVAVNTLKNCMQRVFEDGPKRDRRLWIGDLRLEALTNYYTYKQLDLVRRCLYLFAAADCDADGYLPGYIYENPGFVSGYWFLRDYALLYVVSLCDYYCHTGDEETFFSIYPVAKRQMEAAHRELDANGIYVTKDSNNVFIDWKEGLKKTTSLHGVYLYTLDILCHTLTCLHHDDAEVYRQRYQAAKQAAQKHLYKADANHFANAYDENQISVHAVIWMILGGVLDDEKAWCALRKALESDESEKIVTPYMNHYLVEAMMKIGKHEEAMAHLRYFWGLMVEQGADTFNEVFVPGHPEVSPYGHWMMNSMCHAWSCTPAYFIRKMYHGEERTQK